MILQKWVQRILVAYCLFWLAGCGSSESSVLLEAEPAPGAQLTDSPNSLRLYFAAKPDVANSALRLIGPNGDISLVGLHTMGANDLMIGIGDYPLAEGQYTVQWQLVILDSGTNHTGEYDFVVTEP